MQRSLIAVALGALAAAGLFAAKKADSAPATFQDEFNSAELAAKWATPKGEWAVEDGALTGRELAADHHGAVLTLAIPNKDSRIRFRFRLDGARNFNLSLNHKKGHLFRVNFRPNELTVTTDKVKNDPASKVETIGRAAAKFEAGRWYTVDVEMQGDRVSVKTDNGVAVEASHPVLDTAKPNYRFVMRDGDLRLDDVAVWLR